jgi:hypothetical protein
MADAEELLDAISTVWLPVRVYGEPIEAYGAAPKCMAEPEYGMGGLWEVYSESPWKRVLAGISYSTFRGGFLL